MNIFQWQGILTPILLNDGLSPNNNNNNNSINRCISIKVPDGWDVLFDEGRGGPCLHFWFKSSNFLAARQICVRIC